MAKTNLLHKKDIKKPMTIRLDPAIRKEIKKVAKANDVTETLIVETGIILFLEKVKNEQKAS